MSHFLPMENTQQLLHCSPSSSANNCITSEEIASQIEITKCLGEMGKKKSSRTWLQSRIFTARFCMGVFCWRISEILLLALPYLTWSPTSTSIRKTGNLAVTAWVSRLGPVEYRYRSGFNLIIQGRIFFTTCHIYPITYQIRCYYLRVEAIVIRSTGIVI